MLRTLLRAGALLGVSVGVALSASPAAAAPADPYWSTRTDAFTNASGASNGCTLRLNLRADDGPSASEPGTMELQNRRVVTCPESAGVLRTATRTGLELLHEDGSVETVEAFDGPASTGRYGEPFTGGLWSVDATVCAGSTDGTHTYRARAAVRTWTTTDASDAPFVARAQLVRTITCSN
jgi:hypothetical protein